MLLESGKISQVRHFNCFQINRLLQAIISYVPIPLGTGRIAQEREYSKLIDTANAPIFGVDTQGRVNVWNQVIFDENI